MDANAARLALAWNHFDQLVEALKGLILASGNIEEAKSTATDDALTCLEGRLETAMDAARAALSKVGGGK
jgi:hypothetical protein